MPELENNTNDCTQIEQKPLTLGSLFDGSGGFPLGGLLAGIQPVWASEIEPFAIRVTTLRLPQVKHYGDISTLNGANLEPVDIITFGSPCQDMSIAGKRKGLDGSRSSLFYEAVRVVKEMRDKTNGEKPRWIVWENVPGAFSSNRGADFKAVIETIIGIKEPKAEVPPPDKKGWPTADYYMGNGWSVAYRVLDAQGWGVPQRRKRIYLVGDLAGESAPQVLFESEGLSGYSAASFRAWQGAAHCIENSIGTAGSYTGFDGYNGQLTGDVSSTIGENCGMSTGRNGVVVLNDQGGERMDVSFGKTMTLRAESHHPPCIIDAENISIEYPSAATEESQHSEISPVAFSICSKESFAMKSANVYAGFYETTTARTLDQSGGTPCCNQGGLAIVECPAVPKEIRTFSLQGSAIGRSDENGPQGDGINEDIAFTLNTTDRHAVYAMTTSSNYTLGENIAPTLAARDYKDPIAVGSMLPEGSDPPKGSDTTEVIDSEIQTDPRYTVRRLTPMECARLQGFPSWWCRDLSVTELTEKDLAFWHRVFETHRKLLGKSVKPKTDNQLRKWLSSPHSDSAEYRLWGNGVALPCVYFVLSGIVWAANNNSYVFCDSDSVPTELESMDNAITE